MKVRSLMNKIKINTIDNETSRNLSIVRSNIKLYTKMCDAFNILGSFSKEADAEIFNVDKRLGKVEVAITDNSGDIFIITSKSNNKNDLNIIRKVGDEDIFYDLSLSKKEAITKENIDLCRTGVVLGTRHGRFITDKKTFFSLFLGGNTCYQVITKFDKEINVNPFIEEINSHEEKPTVKEYLYMFGKKLLPHEYDLLEELVTYKDSIRIGSVKLNENMDKGYSKIKKQ